MEKNPREIGAEEFLRWQVYMKSAPGVLKGEGRRKYKRGLWRRDGVDLTLLLGEGAHELEGDRAFSVARVQVRSGRLIRRREEHLVLRSLLPAEKLLNLLGEGFPQVDLSRTTPLERHLLPLHLLLNLPHAEGLGLSAEGSMPSVDELSRGPRRGSAEEEWKAAYTGKSEEVYRAGRWKIRDLRGLLLYLWRCTEDEADRTLRSGQFLSFVRKNFPPLLQGAFERAASSSGSPREALFKDLTMTPLARLILGDAFRIVEGGERGEGLEEFFLAIPDSVLLPELSSRLFSMERRERLWFIQILGRRESPGAGEILRKFQLYSIDPKERSAAEEALRRIEGV